MHTKFRKFETACTFDPEYKIHNYVKLIVFYTNNFVSEYGIRKIQENQVGLRLNGTHQILN
jgi:hypothetical protein